MVNCVLINLRRYSDPGVGHGDTDLYWREPARYQLRLADGPTDWHEYQNTVYDVTRPDPVIRQRCRKISIMTMEGITLRAG